MNWQELINKLNKNGYELMIALSKDFDVTAEIGKLFYKQYNCADGIICEGVEVIVDNKPYGKQRISSAENPTGTESGEECELDIQRLLEGNIIKIWSGYFTNIDKVKRNRIAIHAVKYNKEEE